MFENLVENMWLPMLAAGEAHASGIQLKDIWLAIVAATVLAYVGQLTKQPLVLAYIAAGIVIGPVCLGVISDRDTIEKLSELGLTFLLFIVGLEADLDRLLTTGKRAVPITLVQVIGSGALAFGAAWALGYHGLPGFYIAAAAAFSSTMIALKLLTDRAELESAHGQITLGVLLLQDLVAIVLLAIQPNIGRDLSVIVMLLAVVKGLGLVAAAILVARYLLPLPFRVASRSPELMVLSAISWCFLVCYAALWLKFSIAMGALVAGVSMSAFPYTLDVIAKIRGLRTFFVTLFFVSLGMLLTRPTPRMIVAAVLISLIVIVSRIVTVWPMAKVMRYSSRVGVLAAIYLSQTSEFGLVLALVGAAALDPEHAPHIGQEVVSLIVLVLIITTTASTYLIQYSHKIASLVVPAPKSTAGDEGKSTVLVQDEAPPAVILVGLWRTGSSLVHELRQASIDFAVIDFSQGNNEKLNRLGVATIYGDISHLDTLEHAGVEHARILICPIPDDFLRGTDNLRLLRGLRKLAPHAKIIVNAESIQRAQALYDAGADYVIVTRVLVARHLVEVISEIGAGILDERKDRETRHLGQRVEVVP